jgi:hypothetical protein
MMAASAAGLQSHIPAHIWWLTYGGPHHLLMYGGCRRCPVACALQWRVPHFRTARGDSAGLVHVLILETGGTGEAQ